mmetsp:Transcript_49604/g.116490  ORF Transcript_49604/g.116490 Transcript_49604/m.116490 type:complete len:469 (-) Transcript_49604:772-2178(-)
MRQPGLSRPAGRRQRGVAVAADRAAPCGRGQRAAPVPAAQGRPAKGPRHRRRGAGALATPGARPGAADAVHPVRRADRLHPHAQRLDAGRRGTLLARGHGRRPGPEAVGQPVDPRPDGPGPAGQDRGTDPAPAGAGGLDLPGDHRERDHGRPGTGPVHAGASARDGLQAVDRRLRYRLLITGLPEAAAGGRAEDRQELCDGDGARPGRRAHRALHHRAGAQPGPVGRRRRPGDGQGLGHARQPRLRRGPGLFHLQADAAGPVHCLGLQLAAAGYRGRHGREPDGQAGLAAEVLSMLQGLDEGGQSRHHRLGAHLLPVAAEVLAPDTRGLPGAHQGQPDGTDRLDRAAARRAGDAGDRQRPVDRGAGQQATRHLLGHLGADGAVLRDQRRRHAQQLGLGLVAVADDATLEPGAGPGQAGAGRGDQAAGAALRRTDGFAPPDQGQRDALDQVGVVGSHGVSPPARCARAR